ncbi:MAG TPA: hypothetical protein VIR54_16300 [Vicinamibacterales bacterium]|jgi:hypothetical protein
MAVLKHPNIDWNNGATAPESIAELVAISSILVFPVANTPVTLPHPDGTTLIEAGAGATPHGYAME